MDKTDKVVWILEFRGQLFKESLACPMGNYMLTILLNTLFFFADKMQCKRFPHFSTKNNCVFVIFMITI